jgi:D-amino-acid oxidase
VPPNVTSNMSLAGFTPTSGLFENDRRTPAWDAQYNRAADISYRQLQLLAGPHFGVSWLDNYSLTNEVRPPQPPQNTERPSLQARFDIGQEVLGPGEHPFATKYAIYSPEIRIEPSIYLDNLVRDFQLWGGHIVIRKFETPRELAALREPIVINCTGLGARDLFGDQELIPLKGQLTVLVPQPEVQYHTNGGVPPVPGATLGIHMMARSDGIALGGTSQRGVWTLEPDEAERKRVVDSHIAVFSAMRAPGRRT